jgi:hypothetical protein
MAIFIYLYLACDVSAPISLSSPVRQITKSDLCKSS